MSKEEKQKLQEHQKKKQKNCESKNSQSNQ